MTQEELDQLAGEYSYNYHYQPSSKKDLDVGDHYQAGFLKALALVQELVNNKTTVAYQGEDVVYPCDILQPFQDLLNP